VPPIQKVKKFQFWQRWVSVKPGCKEVLTFFVEQATLLSSSFVVSLVSFRLKRDACTATNNLAYWWCLAHYLYGGQAQQAAIVAIS